MLNLLKTLCSLDGTSGSEGAVRDFILSEISPYCTARVDALGNIIAEKKGRKTPIKKIMIDAHTDEVGVIASYICEDGLVKFHTVGGINTECLLAQRVRFGDKIGVIGLKPTHLLSGDERKKLPKADSLYIDFGTDSRKDTEAFLSLGDTGVFDTPFTVSGDTVCSKAIDDRAGCALLIRLLKSDAPYDFTATFTVEEEVGTRGAATAAYAVAPEYCICLESTTASDIAGVSGEERVCVVGEGPVVSFMDRGALYDRELYNLAGSLSVPWQTKTVVAGGNNSNAIQRSGCGVRTLAVSIPCRYIHSPSSVASLSDMENAYLLTERLLERLGDGI